MTARFTKSWPPVCWFAFRAATALAQSDVRVTVKTIDGPPRVGVVQSWTLGESLILSSTQPGPDSTLRIDAADIDRIQAFDSPRPVPPPASPAADSENSDAGPPWCFITTDGQRILGIPAGGDAATVFVHRPESASLRIALDRLASLSRPGATPRDIDEPPASDDVILLANGDLVHGLVAGATAATLRLERDGKKQPIQWSVVRAVRFASAGTPAQSPPNRALLRFADGTALGARRLTWRSASIEAVVLDNQRIQFSPRDIRGVEVLDGRRAWLSELTPAAYESHPILGPEWPLGRDLAATAAPLTVAGQTHDRGLGLHSACTATWRLEKRYARFRALAALDDSAGPLADASLRVLVDARIAADFPHLKSNDPARPLDIDLTNADEMTIEVGCASNADIQDRLDLLDAALIRPR